MALVIGTLLHDRYLIEYVIAQGGMGAIYSAQDQSLNVKVAVKENKFFTEQASRQFHREATILAGIRHPNLPRVTDHFIIPEQGQYLVMDYIEGKDLRERLETEKTISEEEAMWIGASICDALSYLHSRVPPIVHRDIKPGNIKITPDGHIFLVDFGLAKTSQVGQSTTLGAQALTPGYAPPEQYMHGTEPRSDIYALGATLYAAMSGHLPKDSITRAMGTDTLTALNQANQNISAAVTSAIEKSMEISVEERFPNAEAFKQAMLLAAPGVRNRLDTQKINQLSGLSMTPSGGKTKNPAAASESIKIRKLPLIGLLGLLFLLILGIAAAIFFISNFGKQNAHSIPPPVNPSPVDGISEPNAQPPTATATLPASLPAAADLMATPTLITVLQPTPIPFIPSPTIASTQIGGGSGQIAFASNRSGKPQIWSLSLADTSPQPISNIPDGACQPSWSPDGLKLVVVSPCDGKLDIYKGSGLFIINADGTGLQPLPMVPGGDFDPDWSPDGTQITFTSIREGIPHIFVYDLNTNKETRLSPPTSNDQHPRWSPDGKWIAFESTRLGVRQIWMMDTQGGSAREISNFDSGIASMPAWSPSGATLIYSSGTNLPWLMAKSIQSITSPEIKVSEVRPVFDAKYSKDGFWLLFQSVRDQQNDLYLMMANGGNLTQLTNDAAEDFQPAWRPPFTP